MSLPHNDGVKRNPMQHLNRLAKRDPQLYPLLGVMIGAGGLVGYMLTHKGGKQAAEPAHHLLPAIMSPEARSTWTPGRSQLAQQQQTPSTTGVDEWRKSYNAQKGEPGADLE